MSHNVKVVNLEQQLMPVGQSIVGEELVVSTVVVATISDWDEAVTHFLVSVKDQPVLVTFDGEDPTASAIGLYLPASQKPLVWKRETLLAAKFLRAESTDSLVRFEPMSVA